MGAQSMTLGILVLSPHCRLKAEHSHLPLLGRAQPATLSQPWYVDWGSTCPGNLDSNPYRSQTLAPPNCKVQLEGLLRPGSQPETKSEFQPADSMITDCSQDWTQSPTRGTIQLGGAQPDEHRFKYCEQNTSKWNSTLKGLYTMTMWDLFQGL